jgi:hypothetical protein
MSKMVYYKKKKGLILMNIEVEDPYVPHREFSDLRKELVEQGKQFDEINLHLVPYSQLYLCCIGNAAEARCSLDLVKQEKIRRRERFLSMELEEFKEVETYLKVEQMYEDVLRAIAFRSATHWDDLSNCQQLWAKLTCLYNHVDNPNQRIQEIIDLFTLCAKGTTGTLPVDVCKVYSSKLKGISSVYPSMVSDDVFREKIGEMAETVLSFMSSEECQLIEKEQLKGFSCTSDCFRVF